ncbi:MAG TPA: tetratricopeptide repeat protein [Vicinamibacteria bacterium]|nr:tetratricopeptide repeat protein [Vicinamibacteria bacterium]
MPPDEVSRLRERALSGDPAAQYELGLRLLHGVGAVCDYTEAERWFRLAAADEVTGAQFCLGYMYDEGKGVARDPAEAARWYEAAAAQGDSDAQHNLALLKWHGVGVKRDRSTALKLMDRALADPADFRRAMWRMAVRMGTWALAALAALMLLRFAWSRL